MPTIKRNEMGSSQEVVVETIDLSEKLDIDMGRVDCKLQKKLAYNTRVLPEHYVVTSRLTLELHREGRGKTLSNSKTFRTKINDQKRIRDRLPFFQSKTVAERISTAFDVHEKRAIEFLKNHKDCQDKVEEMKELI